MSSPHSWDNRKWQTSPHVLQDKTAPLPCETPGVRWLLCLYSQTSLWALVQVNVHFFYNFLQKLHWFGQFFLGSLPLDLWDIRLPDGGLFKVFDVFASVFAPRRMVALPGHSLSGVVASVLLTMKQPGRMPFLPSLHTGCPRDTVCMQSLKSKGLVLYYEGVQGSNIYALQRVPPLPATLLLECLLP